MKKKIGLKVDQVSIKRGGTDEKKNRGWGITEAKWDQQEMSGRMPHLTGEWIYMQYLQNLMKLFYHHSKVTFSWPNTSGLPHGIRRDAVLTLPPLLPVCDIDAVKRNEDSTTVPPEAELPNTERCGQSRPRRQTCASNLTLSKDVRAPV